MKGTRALETSDGTTDGEQCQEWLDFDEKEGNPTNLLILQQDNLTQFYTHHGQDNLVHFYEQQTYRCSKYRHNRTGCRKFRM